MNGNFLRGLAFRVLLFLTLALLPMGLIAVIQTREIAEQSAINAELSLLAITERASADERTLVQEAFGAADALAAVVRLIRDQPEPCSAFLREYQAESGIYTVVTYIRKDGLSDCSSSGGVTNYGNHPVFSKMIERQERMAYVTDNPVVSEGKVLIVTVPMRDNGEVVGFIGMSIPLATFVNAEEMFVEHSPKALFAFNAHGELLTSERGDDDLSELPTVNELRWYVGRSGQVFEDVNKDGEKRTYAVLPIVRGSVYAMSVWPQDSPLLQPGIGSKLSLFLPVAMWIASLVVAFWALNRLAINHIRKLGRQMRYFALNRTLPRAPLGGGVPTEIVSMEAAFIGMAESIMRDEAALEDSLREKNILLKEVHHRVKNNLQLISSIMNMQIRQAKTPDSKLVLQRLQERILSLATVHKSLYQNDNVNRVDGGELIHDIVNQLLSVGLPAGSGVRVDQNYDTLYLDPDDAAPLTLLVSEALTNALKYVGTVESGEGWIEIELKADATERAHFQIRNAVGKDEVEAGTGLGSRLIHAFARQLNGDVEMMEENEIYQLRVTFPVPDNHKQVYDY